jgi:hypothetical protein
MPRRADSDYPRPCSIFTTDQPLQLIGPQTIRKFRDGWQFAKVQPASQLPLRHCRPLKSRLSDDQRLLQRHVQRVSAGPLENGARCGNDPSSTSLRVTIVCAKR